MALKQDVNFLEHNIDFYVDTVCERGGILTQVTAGSGTARDSALNVAAYDASGSGKIPLGILFQNTVNKNLTHDWLVATLDEAQIGSKVTIMTKGQCVTNMIPGNVSPSAGDPAYVGPSGLLTNTRTNTAWAFVGRFDSSKNQDGYAKVSINLPNAG